MSNTDRLTDEYLRHEAENTCFHDWRLAAKELLVARASIAAQKAELEALRGRVGLAKRLLEDAMGTNGQAHHENLIDAKDTLDGVHDDGI